MKKPISHSILTAAVVIVFSNQPAASCDCLIKRLFEFPQTLLSGRRANACCRHGVPSCATGKAAICPSRIPAHRERRPVSTAVRHCAFIEYMDWGTYKSYYGLACPSTPVNIDGNYPDLTDDCLNGGTNKYCLNVVMLPKSGMANPQGRGGHAHQKDLKLPKKVKKEDRDNQGTPPGGMSSVLTRYLTNKPYFVKFKVPSGPNVGQFVFCRLWIIEVRQKNGVIPRVPVKKQAFAVGQEVEEFTPNPNEEISVITVNADDIAGKNVAQVPFGNIIYQVVTETVLQ